MRSIGLVFLLFGLLAIVGPVLRQDLPFMFAFSDQALWIIGASLFAIGVVIIVSTRRDD